jgi:hypothetical protein
MMQMRNTTRELGERIKSWSNDDHLCYYGTAVYLDGNGKSDEIKKPNLLHMIKKQDSLGTKILGEVMELGKDTGATHMQIIVITILTHCNTTLKPFSVIITLLNASKYLSLMKTPLLHQFRSSAR